MKDYLTRLLEYEYWANQAVIQALEQAETPPSRAIQLMGHILSAQQVWMARINDETSYIAIWEDIPLFWMTETAERNYHRMKAILDGHSNESLQHPIQYSNSRGQGFRNPLSDILLHLSHHAAYHRGQVMQLLRPQLDEPPAIDFIVWARGKEPLDA